MKIAQWKKGIQVAIATVLVVIFMQRLFVKGLVETEK